jgi:hypothetical protein
MPHHWLYIVVLCLSDYCSFLLHFTVLRRCFFCALSVLCVRCLLAGVVHRSVCCAMCCPSLFAHHALPMLLGFDCSTCYCPAGGGVSSFFVRRTLNQCHFLLTVLATPPPLPRQVCELQSARSAVSTSRLLFVSLQLIACDRAVPVARVALHAFDVVRFGLHARWCRRCPYVCFS